MREWWPEIAWAVVGAVLSAVVMKVLGQDRKPAARPGRGTGLLRYPKSALGLGIFLAAVGLISFFVSERKADDSPLAKALVFVGFPLGGAALASHYFRVWYQVIPRGMRYQPMWRGESALAWSDVTRVRFVPVMNWYCIQTANGRQVRMSLMLTGLPELARAVLANVPARAMTAETRRLFQQTAAGFLPDDV